jgi:hypothetical protein
VHVVRGLALLIAALAVLTACDTGDSASGNGPALSRAALDLLTTSGGYPAREYQLTVAEARLTQRCMTAHGLVYRLYEPTRPVGSDEEQVVDLPSRRAVGYGIDTPGGGEPPRDPGSDSPHYQEVLFGDAEHRQEMRLPNGATHSFVGNGCIAQARLRLYGDLGLWSRIVTIPPITDNDLRDQVSDAPELARAMTRWATCMAEAGYPYPTPEAASTAVSEAYQKEGHTPAMRDREIATAVADGECALRAHVPATELSLRRAAAKSLPAAARRELNELAAAHCAAARTAQTVTLRRASTC